MTEIEKLSMQVDTCRTNRNGILPKGAVYQNLCLLSKSQ